jgi:S-layer homology domain
MRIHTRMRLLLAITAGFCSLLAGGAIRQAQDVCGPFTDVSPALCPYVLEMYYLGITAGTSPTTFSPDAAMTRGQAAVFVSKGVNQALARSSRRASLGQWWTTTPRWNLGLGTTPVGFFPSPPVADGADIWVPTSDDTIARVRASDGRLLETWTGADGPALAAMGRVFVAKKVPARLTVIDPAASPGAVTVVAEDIGTSAAESLAFDGERIWATTCCAINSPPLPPPPGSLSIITPGTWSVTTIANGFLEPYGLAFDGTHMWVTDREASAVFRLDASGAITHTIPIPNFPGKPAYDGVNIWVPSGSGIVVIRAATGEVVATLLDGNAQTSGFAAFDGSRVLVFEGDLGSLWNAQSLSLIGTFETGYSYGLGVASDGINFWLSLDSAGVDAVLARF